MALVTMRELLEAGIHFGHQTRRWNPKMARYIYGQRNGIYVIDLQHSLRQLYRSYSLVRDIVTAGGHVLFVGTKRQAQEAIQREAERCGMYHVTSRWLGGTLTNYQTVRQSISELFRLQGIEKDGTIDRFSKKEAAMMRKQRVKLEKNLLGIQQMPGMPGAIFIIDTKREAIAVREARRLKIPCIGVVDTNSDPDEVDLPIPGNDDAIRAVNLYCRIIADAVIEGKMRAEKLKAEEEEERRSRHEGADAADDASTDDAEAKPAVKEDDAYDAQYVASEDKDAAKDTALEADAVEA
jgi:small subunit ribosomal protein S2